MENTLKNKAKFYAQYWGQKVRNWNMNEPINGVVGATYMTNYILSHTYILLNPLSKITEEDAIWVATKAEWTDCHKKEKLLKEAYKILAVGLDSTGEAIDIYNCFEIVDYLRSKGYAVPYNGVSVEKQIEYGWVKLKTN